ncbi:MAG: DNA polymerase III subunit gamma and tau [Gordonia sp. (in: high G+C Gram-positive bacteria)]|uniref:DNA polymerase III subunit gamma and tau n=1 Tax=Gordonia sp. (in: high G+C Gram-positive bacteria) TaxID=84139 RepID=UPI0039E61E34
MALYRTYRPATFAEVVGQEHVTDPLSRALDGGRINHAYLFSGPRGCGKTSSARILARSLNCVHGPTSTPCGECSSCVALGPGGPGNLDVVELDAASHGGVDDTRELRDRAFYAPAESRYRVFIIDEAHMVTSAGFNALLKIVEEPPEHLIFIFATTEPEKVLTTIRSRTHHYPFRLLAPPVMRGLLERICQSEGAVVAPEVFPLVIRAGGGSPRDSLSILDQLLAGAGEDGVTYDRALGLLGVTDTALIDAAVDALAAGDGAALFGVVERVVDAGHDPRRFAIDLLDRFRDLLLLQAVPDAAERGLVEAPADQVTRMRSVIDYLGMATLTRYAEVAHAALGEMRGTTSPRLLLEVMCARLLLPAVSADDAGLLQRLETLERRPAAGPPIAAAPAVAGSAPPPAEEPPSRFVRPSQRRTPGPVEPAATAPETPVAPTPAPSVPEERTPAPPEQVSPAPAVPPAPEPSAPVERTSPPPTPPTPTPTPAEPSPVTEPPRARPEPEAPAAPAPVPPARVSEPAPPVTAPPVSAPPAPEPLEAEAPVASYDPYDDIPPPEEPYYDAPPEEAVSRRRPAASRQAPASPSRESSAAPFRGRQGRPAPQEQAPPPDRTAEPPRRPRPEQPAAPSRQDPVARPRTQDRARPHERPRTPEPRPEPQPAARPQPTPEPRPAPEPAAPQLTVEAVSARWADIRAAVRERPSGRILEPMLSAATVQSVGDHVAVLGHANAQLVGRLADPARIQMFGEIFGELFGGRWQVQVVHAPGGAPAAASPPRSAAPAPQRRQQFTRRSRPPQGGDRRSAVDAGPPPPEPPPEPEEPWPADPVPVPDEELTDAERDEMVASAHTGTPDARLDPDQVALELLKSELGARPVADGS